jgi:hypothetical protein
MSSIRWTYGGRAVDDNSAKDGAGSLEVNMPLKVEYDFIRFVEQPNVGKKTRIFLVENTQHGSLLGWIHWYGPWRQYCFLPQDNTIFSIGCLQDIQDFIKQLVEERKEIKREIRTREG